MYTYLLISCVKDNYAKDDVIPCICWCYHQQTNLGLICLLSPTRAGAFKKTDRTSFLYWWITRWIYWSSLHTSWNRLRSYLSGLCRHRSRSHTLWSGLRRLLSRPRRLQSRQRRHLSGLRSPWSRHRTLLSRHRTLLSRHRRLLSGLRTLLSRHRRLLHRLRSLWSCFGSKFLDI